MPPQSGARVALARRAPILRDVNLEINNLRGQGTTGQVVGLLGPSGMGKTKLFRILAGLDRPDRARCCSAKQRVPVERGMVGVVAQELPAFRASHGARQSR